MNQSGKRRLLLVEDDFLIRMDCALTLEGFGYDVLCAETGEEAVGLAASEPRIDLILMDIDLGKGLSGPEAAAIILDGRSLPIVFLSSHAEREMVERVRGITRYGYVIKNSGAFVLQSSIEMAFDLFEAHRSLAERDERYRLLADNVADVLWILDPRSGKCSYVSPSVERLTGYSVEEAMGFTAGRVMTGDYAERFTSAIARRGGARPGASDPDLLDPIEVDLIRKDGSRVWTEAAMRFAESDRGEPIVIGVTRDISARKAAEEALRESLELHLAVLRSAMDGFCVISEAGRLLEVNEAFCRMSGYSEQELLSMAVEDLEAIEDPESIRLRTRRMVELGEERFETRHRRKDGTTYRVAVSIQYRPFLGGCFVAFARDLGREGS